MKRLLLLHGMCCSTPGFAQSKPNIVLIVPDDYSYQTIGVYNNGQTDATPAIGKLIKEEVTFSKAFVTNSIYSPSGVCILTRRYSHKNGFMDNETSHYNPSRQ